MAVEDEVDNNTGKRIEKGGRGQGGRGSVMKEGDSGRGANNK